MLTNKNDANKKNASTKSADPTQESQDCHQGTPSQKSYSQEDFPDGDTVLVGLCPTCLQLQVTKMLITARQRRSNTAGTQLLHQLVPGRLDMVNNTYYLKRPWKDNWGNSVGGKFIQSFCIFFNDTISYPVVHYVSMKSGPVSTYVLQSLSNAHLVQHEAFEVFNATVLPVSCNWEFCKAVLDVNDDKEILLPI
jgi:hypothetical protein